MVNSFLFFLYQFKFDSRTNGIDSSFPVWPTSGRLSSSWSMDGDRTSLNTGRSPLVKISEAGLDGGRFSLTNSIFDWSCLMDTRLSVLTLPECLRIESLRLIFGEFARDGHALKVGGMNAKSLLSGIGSCRYAVVQSFFYQWIFFLKFSTKISCLNN